MSPETLTWLQKQKPQLVDLAQSFVLKSELYKESGQNKGQQKKEPKVKTHQIRNLLGAAQAGEPLAVLVNFLRFQRGRASGWTHKPSGEALEKLFTKGLPDLIEKRPGVVTEASESKNVDDEIYEIESYLAAQLLGFIVREYTYRCAIEGTRA